MISKLVQIYQYDFTEVKFSKTLVQYLAVNVIMFAIPFILGQPQLLVGSIVNLCLIYIAVNYKKNELLPAIFLPALASVLRGVVWGPLTGYLVAVMPFIWLGNAVLVMGIRYLLLKNWQHIFSLFIPGLLKVGLLFGVTFLLVRLLHFPVAMLTSMGLIQLFTFSIAAASYLILAFTVNRSGSKKS